VILLIVPPTSITPGPARRSNWQFLVWYRENRGPFLASNQAQTAIPERYTIPDGQSRPEIWPKPSLKTTFLKVTGKRRLSHITEDQCGENKDQHPSTTTISNRTKP